MLPRREAGRRGLLLVAAGLLVLLLTLDLARDRSFLRSLFSNAEAEPTRLEGIVRGIRPR